MGPKKGSDGKYAITFPMGTARLSGIAAEDIGKCAYALFKRGKEFIGKTIGIAGEHLTLETMAKSMTKALGVEIQYNSVPPDVYRGFGFPGADDVGNMFQIYMEFEGPFTDMRDVNFARQLNPQLKTFDQWLGQNKSRIPLE